MAEIWINTRICWVIVLLFNSLDGLNCGCLVEWR